MRSAMLFAGIAAMLALPAQAQRAGENVIRAAEDAFGLSIGNERLGLYSDDNVRGFSPSSSGNVRLDGLYFDRRAVLSARLVRGSTIRVGLTAQGYDFPAPSGIVDYALRSPSGTGVVSTIAVLDSWGKISLEADADLRLSETLALGVGASRSRDPLAYGETRDVVGAGAIARWRPNASFEVTPYFGVGRASNEEAGPIIFTTGAFLPPHTRPRRSLSQDWTDAESLGLNYGALLRAQITPELTLRGGLFHSGATQKDAHVDVIAQTDAAGRGSRFITRFPEQEYISSSGELRLTRSIVEGPRRHALLASARGRDRRTVFGGSASAALGAADIFNSLTVSEPDFVLGPRSRDTVRQRTLAAGYQGVWSQVGELNIGIQRTRYERDVRAPNGGVSSSNEAKWLWNVNAAAYLTRQLTVFGGYTRGLEDGGFAPTTAANANAALPATISRQADLGVRVALERVRLVAAVFQIEKPYYALGPANVFGDAGEIRGRGAEVSVIANPVAGLRIVGGVILTDPEVRGGVETSGRTLRPIGAVERLARLSADYSPPQAPAWSFDASLGHWGPRVARVDNRLSIPAHTNLDLGVRYRFKVAGAPAVARLTLYNATDVRVWAVTPAGGFFNEDPRRLVASLYTDF